jgi:hypothetical protein
MTETAVGRVEFEVGEAGSMVGRLGVGAVATGSTPGALELEADVGADSTTAESLGGVDATITGLGVNVVVGAAVARQIDTGPFVS